LTIRRKYAKIKCENRHLTAKVYFHKRRAKKMKYKKIIDIINKEQIIDKEEMYSLYQKIYKNENIRSFDNMITYFKSNNIMNELEKNKYSVITKGIYKYSEKEEAESRIYKLLYKEYPKINFIVWNTKILNDFTLHYVMKNFIVVETEKYAIDLFVEVLKENLPKKYTIITQDMLNLNRNIYMNDENLIVIKPLRVKSPLENIDNKKVISIEKIMVDLYIDKLYLYYQGKELQTIYENIFEKYDINMKKLLNYANLRMNIEIYKKYLNNLNIPQIYKY
jgi:hypothetical protein